MIQCTPFHASQRTRTTRPIRHARLLWLCCLLLFTAGRLSPVHGATATILDAWWTNQQDLDGDGCVSGTASDMARLYWQSRVTGGAGSLSIFEKLYFRPCGS